MSEEDLDVIRRWRDSWNATDLDAFADTFDADAELITDPSWVEAGPFKGRAAIKGWFEGLKESYERETIILRELFEAGDKVVARIDWQTRGRATGIETVLDATSVNVIKNGKIVRQQWYFDHAKALEVVGLPE
jgi:ketosteroid isomerase-like protein